MDMSDLFKKYLAKTTNHARTVQDRKEVLVRDRKSKRETLANVRRNIDANMSPFCTPVSEQVTKKNENKPHVIKASAKNVPDHVTKRLEMLAKWKVEKAKQKQIEKASKKPIFKVCHMTSSVAVNLEDVNRVIKGKEIKKSHFAPDNHKFKPPNGIKPVNFNVSTTQNKVSKNWDKTNTRPQTPIVRPPKLELTKAKYLQHETEIGHRKLPHSVKPTPLLEKTKPVSLKPSLRSTRRDRQTPTSSASRKDTDSKEAIKKPAEKSIKAAKKNPSSSAKKKPLEEAEQDAVNVELAEGNKTPVYISPFVTISRGKTHARDEFKMRRILGNKSLTSTDLNTSSVFTAHTSPQAGADYFVVKLDLEIIRINKLCEVWQNYLQDSELPEEARASIDVAIGQSKLLITKKFEQFRSLIVQCKTQKYEEKVITCEDLHGFWDMVYMQVEDLDKRFANLDKLKMNNWTEVLPAKKTPIKKTRTHTKKVGGTSRLKDMIKAAREKQKAEKTEHVEDDKNLFCKGYTRTPLKEQKVPQSETIISSKQKILRVSLATKGQNRCSSSPCLAMMRLSQSIKHGNGLTPARGILKTDVTKSTGKKSVAFKDSSSPEILKKERKQSVRRSINFSDEEKENTPRTLRRSVRLAKNVFS